MGGRRISSESTTHGYLTHGYIETQQETIGDRDTPAVVDQRGEVQSHAVLLARAADGDHAAFHRFYLDTEAFLRRYVSVRVAPSEVDDVMAETYLRAYRSADRFRDEGRPAAAWLVTIARNLVASHHRTRARRAARGPINTGDARLCGEVDEELMDRSGDAELLEALAELKPRQRRILELRFIEERTVAECAAELSLTDQGVRALTYRALQAMRTRLGHG